MERSVPQSLLPIKVERSSECLTSLGGLLVEELARGVGLWEQVDGALAGPKSGRGYPAREFVQALVWMLLAGGRGLEDLRELRAEQEVLKRLGLEAVPDAGTVGGLVAPGRAGGGGGKAAGESGTGQAVLGRVAGGSDSGRGCDGDRCGEAGCGVDLQQAERLPADAGVHRRGVRGAPVPGRQLEIGERDAGVRIVV